MKGTSRLRSVAMRFLQSAFHTARTLFTAQSPAKFVTPRMCPKVTRRSCSTQQPIVFEIESVEDFQEHVVNSATPVIVDFHATWCGPCASLGPRLEEKVFNRGGAVLMAKVDVDDAGELAASMDISSVPTVMAYSNGECVASFTGNVTDDQLDSFIEQTLESTQ